MPRPRQIGSRSIVRSRLVRAKVAPGDTVTFTPNMDSPRQGLKQGKPVKAVVVFSQLTGSGEVMLQLKGGQLARVPLLLVKLAKKK